ncbi:MAG: hypothetical protein QM572_08790 [Nocardioides sp.]|uniref:hypothetical protein n=1 Tax=Nocardioides sp. TaxID=35761 RepID=UPI0039E5D1E3
MRTEALGPTADGSPLQLSVECRTSRNASRGRPHWIRIHADWSVETPHDLAAERVAAAFGGFTSCLELVDDVIPAVARSMGLLSRREPLPVQRRDGRSWHVKRIRGCCSAANFTTVQNAGDHLRSPAHLARQYGVAVRGLKAVLEAVNDASDAIRLDRVLEQHPGVGGLVLEGSGIRDLWAAGIHPSEIPAMAAHAVGVREALPVSYFVGLRYAGTDPDWLARTIVHRPDPMVASWLAWTSVQSSLACDDVGSWLAMGVGRQEIEALTAAMIGPGEAVDLATATHRATRSAARILAVWGTAGCRPSADQISLLDRHGIGDHVRPSAAAIDLLVKRARPYEPVPSRTELAVMLALTGSAHDVEVALSQGVRRAEDLA